MELTLKPFKPRLADGDPVQAPSNLEQALRLYLTDQPRDRIDAQDPNVPAAEQPLLTHGLHRSRDVA